MNPREILKTMLCSCVEMYLRSLALLVDSPLPGMNLAGDEGHWMGLGDVFRFCRIVYLRCFLSWGVCCRLLVIPRGRVDWGCVVGVLPTLVSMYESRVEGLTALL